MDDFQLAAPAAIIRLTNQFLEIDQDPRVTDCVTIVRGYTELLALHPNSVHCVEKLRIGLRRLLALAYEKRQLGLVAQLGTLTNQLCR